VEAARGLSGAARAGIRRAMYPSVNDTPERITCSVVPVGQASPSSCNARKPASSFRGTGLI
jgi:hypothetical protein